jgi:hypothetical protein
MRRRSKGQTNDPRLSVRRHLGCLHLRAAGAVSRGDAIMTGGKPTPGPWSAFVMGKTVAVDIGLHPTGNRPNIVDWTGFDGCDLPFEEQVANAHLIAAAPDMRDVIEPLIVIALDMMDALDDMDPETRQECERDIAKARAAIAKASGGVL